MRFLYALAAVAFLSAPVFAQAAADQFNPEIVVVGSPSITATIFNYTDPLPPAYFPQDTSATLYVGASLFTANNDGTTGIGVVYSQQGVTAAGVVALTSNGTQALGCVDDQPDPASDISNDITGKIVLIRRGLCSFSYKVINAMAGGAVGVIIYNGDDRKGVDDTIGNMVVPETFNTPLTIPAMLVPNGIGQPIVDDLSFGSGAVTLTMRRQGGGTAAAPGPRTTESGLELRGSNPFSTSTQFRVYTEQPEAVRVEVYNVRGQQVATLFDGAIAGDQDVTFRTGSLASGVYFVRATGETFIAQEQITIVR